MDENYLKRFGFLPPAKKEDQKSESRRKPGRRKSERFYIQDEAGVYLTTREAEVSWLIAEGCTIREAAKKIDLSPCTVEFYLCNVRRKLGVRYKHELLRILHDSNFFRHNGFFQRWKETL